LCPNQRIEIRMLMILRVMVTVTATSEPYSSIRLKINTCRQDHGEAQRRSSAI
jgi:hypothetical protein